MDSQSARQGAVKASRLRKFRRGPAESTPANMNVLKNPSMPSTVVIIAAPTTPTKTSHKASTAGDQARWGSAILIERPRSARQ